MLFLILATTLTAQPAANSSLHLLDEAPARALHLAQAPAALSPRDIALRLSIIDAELARPSRGWSSQASTRAWFGFGGAAALLLLAYPIGVPFAVGLAFAGVPLVVGGIIVGAVFLAAIVTLVLVGIGGVSQGGEDVRQETEKRQALTNEAAQLRQQLGPAPAPMGHLVGPAPAVALARF